MRYSLTSLNLLSRGGLSMKIQQSIKILTKHLPILVGFYCCSMTISAAQLSVVTEEGSLQYSKGNEITGIATELVKAVLEQANITGDFQIYPWTRAYNLAQTQPNVLIYSMARTPQRENKFKWIGEIAPLDYKFFRLKSNNSINPKILEQAKKFRVGVINQGAIHHFVNSHGFNNVSVVSNSSAHLRVFLNKRVDLIIINSLRLDEFCQNTKIDCDLIEPVMSINEISKGLYMALSLKTGDYIHQQLVTAFQTVKSQGTYQHIMQTKDTAQ